MIVLNWLNGIRNNNINLVRPQYSGSYIGTVNWLTNNAVVDQTKNDKTDIDMLSPYIQRNTGQLSN